MLRVGVLSLLVSTTLLAGGCTASPPPKTAPRTVEPTPLARLNTEAMTLARVDFCSLIPASAVRDAAGPGARRTTWRDGSVAPLGRTRDVAHEFGCSWTGSQATAAAWIFAMPVDVRLARQVRRDATVPHCVVRAATFGSPSLVQTCTWKAQTRVRYAGLFTDTWLTCEASSGTLPAATVSTRAQAWCVQVANAVNTQR